MLLLNCHPQLRCMSLWKLISVFADLQFRVSILTLELETGRYTPIHGINTKMNRKRLLPEIACTLCNTEP